MEIKIKQLSVELLEDWLYFFDNIGFSDNSHWSGCYCMCNHWDKHLKNKYNWNTEIKKGINSSNRESAINLIKSDIMKGYLAYNNENVVGWCNANEKNKFTPIFGDLPWEESEKNVKIITIMCFCISPELRNKGIASKLLEEICLNGALDGYKYIEAYPFTKSENNNYQGPLNMFVKHGFKVFGETGPCTIVRKYL